MEDNIDLMKCRLCLEKADENEEMIDLFLNERETVQNECGIEASKMFYEKVEQCLFIRIRESPEMPSKICCKCFDMTRVLFNFRQMVLNTQVYLESMCTDREIPPEIGNDERKYMNYLLEDLQIVKDEFIADIDDLSNNNDDDYVDISDSDFIEIKNEAVVRDSDSDVEKMIHSITKVSTEELYDVDEVKNEVTKITAVTKMPNQRQIIAPKQLKKLVRPPSPNSYMCTICGNVYHKKASFKNHMNIHSNIKPHQCEICNKAFRQVSELKNHMRRHTGEKPYQCAFCERRFIDRSEKLRHERVHTNTRPYKCNVCDKSFAYSTILKNHSKLHSGKKDFHCIVCQKYFSLPHQLKAHLQTITHKQKESQFVEAGYEVVYE